MSLQALAHEGIGLPEQFAKPGTVGLLGGQRRK